MILCKQLVHAPYYLFLFSSTELYKMVCTENDTSINVTIPVVMIPKSAGDKLMEFMANGGNGELSSYVAIAI